MGVVTGLCSRLASSHSRAWGEGLRTGLGTDTEPSWASCRETLLLLAPGRPDLALLGGLPGWPAACLGLLPALCFLMAVPAQALPGLRGGCSGTHSKPPLTCLRPARVKIDVSTAATSTASTFPHLSPCQRLLSQRGTKCRAEPRAGAPPRGLAARECPTVPEVTLCVPPQARGPPCSPPGLAPRLLALCPPGLSAPCPPSDRTRKHSFPLTGPVP